MARSKFQTTDWYSFICFFLLSFFGWLNIHSAAYNENNPSIFDIDEPYGKQFLWIILSCVIILVVFLLSKKFFERFSSLIYLVSMLSLFGLIFFGKKISGATSWYAIGPISIQPSEFAKSATSLALAKYMSDINTNIKRIKDQVQALIVILIPPLLIMLQPDAGSALVFGALVFPLLREGVSMIYIYIGASAVSIFIFTLLFSPKLVSLILAIITLIVIYIRNKQGKNIFYVILLSGLMSLYSFSTDYIFHNVFKQHHRDRINLVLGKKTDTRGIGYNTNQSQIAIGSGGMFGKGWKKGTQTQGGFVPEQHTDYIFSTVGEEWGFVGSSTVIFLFCFLILRVLIIAERQKSQFNRVYGYSVGGILFIHFFVNIGMVIGLLPTVGIPLPFLSYGGSGLWGFAILLFILLKIDSERFDR